MKVLVIGSGGREHAIARALRHSHSVDEVHAAPGNDGMIPDVICHPNLNWRETTSIIEFCLRNEIDFVFIGPEDPLVAGLADSLRDRGILVVGPNKEAAQLEGSKIFAKHFMNEAGVPTADYKIVASVSEAMATAHNFTPPYILKADGLAAGKGVFICQTLGELETAAGDLFERRILGDAGSKALLEQCIPGWELSFLVLTNGQNFEILPLAQDHKRLQDGDKGPNTGGMGTIAPLKIPTDLHESIVQKIIKPSVNLLKEKGMIFRGILFVGVMVHPEKGPFVLEYNTRLGDPETQVILPLLDNDCGILFQKLAQGELVPLKYKNLSSCCVVMAAEGYPAQPKRGVGIEGNLNFETPSSYFIHAGTVKSKESQTWTTNGGRVICGVGLGSSRAEAISNAYKQTKHVSWPGMQVRGDIGSKDV